MLSSEETEMLEVLMVFVFPRELNENITTTQTCTETRQYYITQKIHLLRGISRT